MHEIRITQPNDSKALTQAVVQITQLLGLYQAELARVLGVQCSDVGAFAAADKELQADTDEWRRARQFATLYERLYRHFAGDSVAIYHWLRAGNLQLGGVPLLLMVDEGRLDDVVDWFDSAIARNPAHGDTPT
jgi:hypothetical protein